MAQIVKGGLVGPTAAQSKQQTLSNFGNSMRGLQNIEEMRRKRQDMQLAAAAPGFEQMLADFAGSENLLAREDPQALFDYYNTIYGPVKAAKMVAEKTQGNLSADAERMNTALSILRGETLPGYEGFRNAWSANTDAEKYAALQEYQKSLEDQIAAAKAANPEADTSALEDELYYANFATQRYDEDTGEFAMPSRVEPTNRWLKRQMGKENWSTWGVPIQESLEKAAVNEVKSDAVLNKMDQNRGGYPQGYGGNVSLNDFAPPQYPAPPAPSPLVNNSRAAVPPGVIGANNTSGVNRIKQPVVGGTRTPVTPVAAPVTPNPSWGYSRGPVVPSPYSPTMPYYPQGTSAPQNPDASRSTVPGMLPYDIATQGQDAHHPTAVGEGEGIVNYYAMQQPGVAELVATLNAKYPNPAANLAPETVPGPNGQPMPNQFLGTTALILGGLGAIGNAAGAATSNKMEPVAQPEPLGPGVNGNNQNPYSQMPNAACGYTPVRAAGQVPPGQAMGLGPGMGYGPGGGQGMGYGYGPQNGYPCVNNQMPVMAPGSVYYNDPREYAYPQADNPQNATYSIFYPEGGQPLSATPSPSARENLETFGNRQANARAEFKNNVKEWWDTTKENVGDLLDTAVPFVKEAIDLRKSVETPMPGFGDGQYALVSNEVLKENPDKYELAADTSGSLGPVPPGMNYVKVKEEAPPVWGYSMGPPTTEQTTPEPTPTPTPEPTTEPEPEPTPQEKRETLNEVKKTARWLSMDNRRFGGKNGAMMNEQVANMLFPEGITLEDLSSTTDKSIEARRKRDEFNEAIRQYNQNYALEKAKLAETKAYHDAQIAAKNALETWSKQNPEKWDAYKYNRELVDKAYVRALEKAKGDPNAALDIMSEYMEADEALRTAVNNSSRMMAEVLGDSTYPSWVESEGKDPGLLVRGWYKMKDLLNPGDTYESDIAAWKEQRPGPIVETTVPLNPEAEATSQEFDQASFNAWFNQLMQ